MSDKFNESYVEIAMRASKQISWKFAKGNYQLFEEYLSEALIGATKGLLTFDESKGYAFITYCAMCISNQIKMLLRKKDKFNTVSLSEFIYSSDEICFEEVLEGPKIPIDDDLIYNDIEKEIMNLVERKFTKTEKKVFELKYMNPNIHQVDIAKHLGISQSYVSRVITKYENKIKAHIYK